MSLLYGLQRARGISADGEEWGLELVQRYQGALRRYAAQWLGTTGGVRQDVDA